MNSYYKTTIYVIVKDMNRDMREERGENNNPKKIISKPISFTLFY